MSVIDNDREEQRSAARDYARYGPLGGWRDLASRGSWARQHPVLVCLCVVCRAYRTAYKHPGPCERCGTELRRPVTRTFRGDEIVQYRPVGVADDSLWCPSRPGEPLQYHDAPAVSPDDFTFLLTEVHDTPSTEVSSLPERGR